MSAEGFSKYDNALRKLYDEISCAIQAKSLVSVSGMKNFDLPYFVDPHILTIALAFASEARLAAIVFITTCLVFTSLLVPRIRNPLLKFFQLE
jgi:hypothetical protein